MHVFWLANQHVGGSSPHGCVRSSSASQVAGSPDASQPGFFQIEIRGARGPERLRVRCGQGTTPQWVRQQIVEQYLGQS